MKIVKLFTYNIIFVFVFIMILMPVVVLASKQEEKPPFPNSRFAKIDGINLHYRYWQPVQNESAGSVFLVHGFGASTFSWQQVADSLAGLGYEVIAIDVPPFGYSDKSPRLNTSPTFRADIFIRFLKKEYPGRQWHLAGHSMGGGIVQAMALMDSERFQSVNFTAAAMFRRTEREQLPFYKRIRIPYVNKFGAQIAENWIISPSRIERILESAYGREATDYQVEHYLKPLLEPGTAQAILSMRTNNRNITRLDASQISIPWIALWGDNDTWVALIVQQQLALNKMPDINLHIIENSGHNPHETHLEEYLGIYLTFLNELAHKP